MELFTNKFSHKNYCPGLFSWLVYTLLMGLAWLFHKNLCVQNSKARHIYLDFEAKALGLTEKRAGMTEVARCMRACAQVAPRARKHLCYVRTYVLRVALRY